MTIYSRADWGGGPVAPARQLDGPLHYVFIHHTVASTPASVQEALAEVRRIWNDHTSPSSSDPSKPWPDIGYSWLVDDEGNAYEGLGWLQRGIHTSGSNSIGHGIVWMGNAMVRRPSNKALACIAQLIVNGQRDGAVGLAPTIEGHRDRNPTACPGDLLYAQLPIIRAAVLDLPPATIDPPKDDMTPTQEAKLDRVLDVAEQIATGQLTGAIVREIDPRLNLISAQVDAIRGTAIDLAVVPTSVLVAELGRRATQ